MNRPNIPSRGAAGAAQSFLDDAMRATEGKVDSRPLTERFLQPYFIFNTLICVLYVVLRVMLLSPTAEMKKPDMFGVTRELQIYLCFGLMLVTRAFSARTKEALVSSFFSYARVAIIASLWYMDRRLLVLFPALWGLLHALCPHPRGRLPDPVETFTAASLGQRVRDAAPGDVLVVWCHASWSPRCAKHASVLTTLARTFVHPRVSFGRLDVAKYADTARTLRVSTATRSKQLPCAICIRQGREVARFPVLDADGQVPKEFERSFNSADVAKALNLSALMRDATAWEVAAMREAEQAGKPKKKGKQKK